MNYKDKWPVYAKQWDAMSINPSRVEEFRKLAQFAVDHKAQYKEIQDATNVPWPLIAVLHRRESDADFNTYLGNGEPLNRVTTLVPKGRGPFSSFKAGAIDALKIDGLSMVSDWRLEKMLYYCELFNGAGYNNRGLASPYVWGGTNQQDRGKYVSDGMFNPNVMDTQPGCAPILKMIAQLDSSVTYVRESNGEATPVTDLASNIIDAMERGKIPVDRNPGEVNIVYVEGMEPDGTPNANRHNAFDDVRCVISFVDGKPKLLGVWEATIETGTYYTDHPIAEDGHGAAMIAFGKQKAWQVGDHRGYDALVQTGGPVLIYRDDNRDYKRTGEPMSGFWGINQHHAYNAPKDNIGYNSAGCLVGRTISGHEEFMRIVRADPRFKADNGYVFSTTVLHADQVVQKPQPIPVPHPDIVKKTGQWAAWGVVATILSSMASYLGAHPAVIGLAVILATIGVAILIHKGDKP